MAGVASWRAAAAAAAFDKPAAAWIIAAVYAAIGGVAVFTNAYLNDEGLLAWFMARAVTEEPAATLFFLESRPAFSVVYAPAAAAGLTAYLLAHVVVAAMAAPLAAGIGRAFGLRWPNVPALVIAASPLMLAGGPAGINNTDAVTGMLLAVWLWAARDKPLAAGAVTGALVFGRYELALFAAAMGLHALIARRDLRFVVGLAIVPVLMLIAGAIYHRDALWPLAFPPAMPSAASPSFAAHGFGASVGETADVLLALTPAIGLAFLLRVRSIGGLERTLAAFAVVFLLFIRGLPYLGWFNFDATARYALPLLPFAALLVGRVVGDWNEDEGRNPAAAVWMFAFLIAAHFADVQGSPALMLAVVVWSAMLVLARVGRAGIVAAVLSASVVAAAPLMLGLTQLRVDDQSRGLRPAAAWISAERPPVVITNLHLLATWLDRTDRVAGVDVYYVVQRDQLAELSRLANAAVGQDDAMRRALGSGFYGEPIYPDELVLDALPAGAVIAVNLDDHRLETWLSDEQWDAHLHTVASGPGWRIGRPRSEALP